MRNLMKKNISQFWALVLMFDIIVEPTILIMYVESCPLAATVVIAHAVSAILAANVALVLLVILDCIGNKFISFVAKATSMAVMLGPAYYLSYVI